MGQGAGHASSPNISFEEQLIPLAGEVTVASFARRLAAADRKSVVVVCGAGISVSAGIPDFRTPGSGLYDNLQKYNLPTPESIFTLDYFKENPLPFFQLAKEIYPGNYAPTPTHAFIKLLQDKGLLRRCFTQNIDTLERVAGINPAMLVEAHGSFGQAHCLGCKVACSSEWVRDEIFADRVPVRCASCGGLVKPDIVFFGEPMPKRFAMLFNAELPEAGLLIVMGSSLQVEPFASTINQVGPLCPRLLINRELIGRRTRSGDGFRFDTYDNYRDVALITDCDAAVRAIAEATGWGADLEALVEAQIQAHISNSTELNGDGEIRGIAGVPSQEYDATWAMQRSWRRHFVPELPVLQCLMRRALDGNCFQIISPGKCESMDKLGVVSPGQESIDKVEDIEGGSALEVCILCAKPDALHQTNTSMSLGFVLSGSPIPDTVSEWIPIEFEKFPDGDVPPVSVSIMVPPLRKSQVAEGETVSYELWLLAERPVENGHQKEGTALARVGPLWVARNSEGVAVANSFARMAVRSVIAGHGGNSKSTGVQQTEEGSRQDEESEKQ